MSGRHMNRRYVLSFMSRRVALSRIHAYCSGKDMSIYVHSLAARCLLSLPEGDKGTADLELGTLFYDEVS